MTFESDGKFRVACRSQSLKCYAGSCQDGIVLGGYRL